MALQKIILDMNAAGESATLELGDGRWCHTSAYFQRRYALKPKRTLAPKPTKEFTLLDKALGKLTPSERILLLAQFED